MHKPEILDNEVIIHYRKSRRPWMYNGEDKERSEKQLHRLITLSESSDVQLLLQVQRNDTYRNTLEQVIEWGEEHCVEHSAVEWPAELGGGTAKRQRMKRRRCQHCWQALKAQLEEEK